MSLRQAQIGLSAAAVFATAAVTLGCLAEQAPNDLTWASLVSDAWCLLLVLLAIAPPLAFGALGLRRDLSPEAAWAQLLTTLGIAGYLSCSYLDVVFQAFGPHRRSSTESLVFILAPLSAFPLGGLGFVFIWGAGKVISHFGGLAEPAPAPIDRATGVALAQEGVVGPAAHRRRGLAMAFAFVAVLGLAYFAVTSYRHRHALRALARIAKDTSTPPEVLDRLAERKELQYDLAENPSTPPATLARLAALPDPLLRPALASNPSTPPEALCELAELTGTSDWEIRRRVERNPSTPSKMSAALWLLHPPGQVAEQSWRPWPKESQLDCAQFEQPRPARP